MPRRIEGWEASLAELEQAQDAVTAARERRLVPKLARRPDRPLAITGARLFDAEAGAVRPNMSVLIEGDRIQAVAPDGELTVPEGTEVLDAAGRTLLPGLWDMHVHLGDSDGMLHLAAGVTAVRDLANDTDKLLELKRKYEAGVTLVAGTDSLAGFALHRELELYVDAGIPAPRVLQIATWEAARVARRGDQLGSIAPGKLADLVLVDGAPDQSIRDIRRIDWVMQNGTIYRPEALYQALGVS
ncbi:MAG TPA: amidohydrolase family protein [Acidobacteriota bacterium]